MISFESFGKTERLGNHLFQYVFLRTTARRLQVKFHCPDWVGESIFLLNDDDERTDTIIDVNKLYRQPYNNCGYTKCALNIKDGTDIIGYFQSERYFDRENVKKWFAFKDDAIALVKDKYKNINFHESTGLHLRFGDMKNDLKYMLLPKEYYSKALSKIRRQKNVLVFSDEIESARQVLDGIDANFIYVSGNRDYEDLYLMTRCHDFICSVSTFSWWGAWLNDWPDKIVVAPPEGIRSGHYVRCPDFCCKDWIPVQTARFLFDDYRFLIWRQELRKARARNFKDNVWCLKNYLMKKIKKTKFFVSR